MSIIYIFTFPNGKQYIGQTTNLTSRYRSHRSRKKTYIGRAIQKYGWKNILIDEIECPEKFLDEIEQVWIKNFGTLAPNGYNLDSGGHETKHHSEKTKKKMSAIMTGNKNSLGHQHSKETKEKMSIAKVGHRKAEETKKKISVAMIGHTCSEETKLRISKALTKSQG